MNIKFFDSKEVGDLVSRMNDAEIVEETTTELLGQILIDILGSVVTSYPNKQAPDMNSCQK